MNKGLRYINVILGTGVHFVCISHTEHFHAPGYLSLLILHAKITALFSSGKKQIMPSFSTSLV